jgi:hypothetical protein
MAGAINKDHQSFKDFSGGMSSHQAPLSAIDKKMLNFAITIGNAPNTKTHGQIIRNFGMYPPEFWMRAQRLTGHPEIDPAMKEQLGRVFADPAHLGMTDGTEKR